MIGLGEILGITSLVLQVIAAVDKVVLMFDRAQNAPEELRRFQSSLSRLRNNVNLLKAELEISGSRIDTQNSLDEIEDTLELCKALFVSYHMDQGSSGTPLRAIWSPRMSAKLEKYQKRIEAHYLEIILPMWMAAIRNASVMHLTEGSHQAQQTQQTQRPQRPPQTQIQTDDPSTTSEPKGTVISKEDIRDLSRRISELSHVRLSDNRSLVENIRERLDQSLLKCWIKLGLPVEEIELFTGIPATARRISNLEFETAPTTITLEAAPENHRKLELERIHVMARDDQTRILLYQSKDMSIQLTHIIPRGSIPWSQRKNSKSVSFLTPHTITVIDKEGHHIYNIVPKYRFHETKHCRSFHETFRERDYLGVPHEAVDITSGGDVLARRQVIKFWKRDSTKEVTITFLASSIGDFHTHWELNVSDYLPEAVYVMPRISRKYESEIVKMRSKRGEPSIHLRFECTEDAKAFKEMYKAVHPSNAPAPRLRTPEATSSNASLYHGTSASSSTRTSKMGVDKADSLLAEWEEEVFRKSTEQ